jgi:beta-glucosidase-like glycosyl hydrolase
MDARLKRLIEEYHPFGLILFYRNIKSPGQVRRLCLDAQRASLKASGRPLMICLDQEGGYVGRFRDRQALFPGPMALAASRSETLLRAAGYFTGLFLRQRGINTNLAPVLDVYQNPHNPSLGPRSFSSDPSEVARLAGEWLTGARRSGILSVGKHFPGKGKAGRDSHLSLPMIRASKRKLMKEDIAPFRALAGKGLDAIMSSHAWYAAFSRRCSPGTLTRSINHSLLRDVMKFRGLLLSDDMEMGAIMENYAVGDAAVSAVRSGVDAVLVCKGPDSIRTVFEALCRAVAAGGIPADVMRESLGRKKTAWKRFRSILRRSRGDRPSSCDREQALDVLRRESPRCITVLKGQSSLPLARERKCVAFLPGRHPRILVEDRKNELRDMKEILRRRRLTSRIGLFTYSDIPGLRRRIRRLSRDAVAIFFASDLYKDDFQKEAFRAVSGRFRDVVTIAVKNPADAAAVAGRSLAVVATYCMTADIQSALVDLLFLGQGGTGVCPVRFAGNKE